MFKHTEIAIVIYMGVAFVGVSLTVLLAWFAFMLTGAIQSTEAVVATLNSKCQTYFVNLPQVERRYLRKCGKATRPAIFDVGVFVQFSIDVTFVMKYLISCCSYSLFKLLLVRTEFSV